MISTRLDHPLPPNCRGLRVVQLSRGWDVVPGVPTYDLVDRRGFSVVAGVLKPRGAAWALWRGARMG
jgi:hypothetical protein